MLLFHVVGDSLGKDKCSGIKEPISIAVKANRTGLGRDALLKQVEKETQELRLKKLEAFKKRQGPNFISTDNFRAEKSNQRRRKQFESDLYQSQKSCRQLGKFKHEISQIIVIRIKIQIDYFRLIQRI